MLICDLADPFGVDLVFKFVLLFFHLLLDSFEQVHLVFIKKLISSKKTRRHHINIIILFYMTKLLNVVLAILLFLHVSCIENGLGRTP